MNTLQTLFGTLIFITVLGCARQETPDEATGQADTGSARLEKSTDPVIPAATISPVNVRIALSPLAKDRLAAETTLILIEATYSGDPKESAVALAGPSGMIDLGKNTKTLAGEGTVVFEQDVIDQALLDKTDGEVQLTINVTSEKTSAAENFLACPFYWETLAEAGRETVEIECSVIGENSGG